jgi:hypothetical protein
LHVGNPVRLRSPGGDYVLCAERDPDPSDLSDRTMLAQLVRAGVRVTLAEHEQRTQDLRAAAGGD